SSNTRNTSELALRLQHELPEPPSPAIGQNQPRFCLRHAKYVLQFEEMSKLGGLFRSHPRLALAFDQFPNTPVGFSGGTKINNILRRSPARHEVNQLQIDWIACVHAARLFSIALWRRWEGDGYFRIRI